MTDLGNAISVLFLVSGAFVMVVLVVMEQGKRLRTHVDSAVETMRLELRREVAEQDIERAQIERRIRDVEKDLLEFSRERMSEIGKVDQALKTLVVTVAELDKDLKARQRQRERRRGSGPAPEKRAG